ncbi:hypothetical protein JZU57_00650, partial [bacterium]|nr:hypothetical protein [bacterium]
RAVGSEHVGGRSVGWWRIGGSLTDGGGVEQFAALAPGLGRGAVSRTRVGLPAIFVGFSAHGRDRNVVNPAKQPMYS